MAAHPSDLPEFRERARAWLAANMPPRTEQSERYAFARGDEWAWNRARELQRILHAGGYAGLTFPVEYGGHGLGVEYQHAFTEESLPYEMPYLLNIPTLGILAATLLDHASEAQKRRHLPAILRGDEVWVQFLSEPKGGSDMAGCVTRADRDGDHYVLNGSKIWSSSAFAADYALCLCRTDWDAPKHRGLSMLIVKIHQPGITVNRIRQLSGSTEFCEEFFDDVRIPAHDLVGAENDGWRVATGLLVHERASVSNSSPYTSGDNRVATRDEPVISPAELARRVGRDRDPAVRRLVAEDHVLGVVHHHLVERVTRAIALGRMTDQAGAVPRLFSAEMSARRADIGLEIGGLDAVVWDGAAGADAHGRTYLQRQANSLGGGSAEMARNIISERILGMPREPAPDRDLPFREVRQGRGGERRVDG